jgi:hypothetical protein
MLAFVVGRAAAVPTIAFLGELPWIKTGAPLIFQPTHGVAMTVSQDGRRRRILDPFGCQDRSESRAWIGVNGDGKAHALQPWPDRGIQIELHIGFMPWILRRAADCHQLRQMIAKAVAVEAIQRARDRAIP